MLPRAAASSIRPSRRTPIIIGIADIKNKSKRVQDAIEPSLLMLSAIDAALHNAGLTGSARSKLQRSIDSVSVVATWTWPYFDLPQLLSNKLNIRPKHKEYSKHGGNQPIKLIDEAARRIACGKSKVAIVTGGEALASRKRKPPYYNHKQRYLLQYQILVNVYAAAGTSIPPTWTPPQYDFSEPNISLLRAI